MALPPAAPARQLKHRRLIDVQVFSRGDGLWDVDARLTDTKTRDTALATGVRPAGAPIHDLLLRLVVDERLTIVAAGSESAATPYPGHCDDHGDAYARLAGLSLVRGFRDEVRQRLGGTLGCTHLTELTQVLPTAVIQAFAGEVLPTQENAAAEQRPMQLDRCHALRVSGDVVRQHYPRWHRPAPTAHSPT